MVDQNGHAQHKVTWTISQADSMESIEGDELHLSPKHAGDFRLSARTDFATAEGTIKVIEGSTLAPGTVKWSSGARSGCKTTNIIPAMPRRNGPDVFQQSRCEDGEYIAAYTSDGVQLWRRKIIDSGAPGDPAGNDYELVGKHLGAHSASICDSVPVGADQKKIRDLLTQHSLSFREQSIGDGVWLVEESNTQCRMWFDEKLVLVKKRKVFVTE
jgi:hypothetical protein